MILAKLCELARREELLANPDYEPKQVSGIFAIGDDGNFIGYMPTAGDDKSARGKTMYIPRRSGRTSGSSADFLVDKSEYVLGIEAIGQPKPRKLEELIRRMGLFRELIDRALQATGEPALAAVSTFLADEAERSKAVEQVTNAGYASNDLFAFEYSGRLVHDLPAVREYFSHQRRVASKGSAQCVICGASGSRIDKHPAVKVPGGTTSGVALVSFNSEAFESYGFGRNENAPVCRDCADAYTTALNRLLSDRYPDPRRPGETLTRRFVRLSPETTAVFWADRQVSFLDLLTSLFDAPRPEMLDALFAPSHTDRVAPPTVNRFYCLVVSGAQGRATLRGIYSGTVEQVEQNIREYLGLMNIGSEQPVPLWRLLASIVLERKRENLPPCLAADVFHAVVFGTLFPQTLLVRAVARCAAERAVSHERAALVRAYLIRNLKREVHVLLNKDCQEQGYRLGRLLAVLERVRGLAQKSLEKAIIARCYGAASTRPGVVFPRLIALAQYHLAKLPRGARIIFQKLLGEILDGVVAPIGVTLSLAEQGQFAVGYYHQRQDLFRKTESKELTDSTENGKEQ